MEMEFQMVDNFTEFEKFTNSPNEDLVTVLDAWGLDYAQKNEDKCTNCQRKILNNMKTKNGCIWCDIKYYKRKNDKG